MGKKKITLADIANILKRDKTKGDTSYWGVVQSKNTTVIDGKEVVTSYNVNLGGNTGTVKCRKLAGAEVGNTVLVTLRSTGEAIVVGTKNGDKDASDAQQTADAATKTFTTETVSPPYKKGDTWIYASDETETRKVCVVGKASGESYDESDWEDMGGNENNYFWYDDAGAHISLAEKSVANVMNTLIDSTGMFIRNGTTVLSKFTSSLIELGKNSTSAVIQLCGGKGTIKYGKYETQRADQGIRLYSPIEYTGLSGDYYSELFLGGTTSHGTAILLVNGYNQTAKVELKDSNVDITASTVYIDGAYGITLDTNADVEITANNVVVDGTFSCSTFSPDTINATTIDCSGTVTAGYLVGYVTSNYTTAYSSYAGRGSNGQIGNKSSSSRRFKENIVPLSEEQKERIHKLYDVDVKSWNYKGDYIAEDDDLHGKTVFGLIAEDVVEAIPELEETDKDGVISNYKDTILLNAMLVLIQEQHSEIESIKERISK